MDLERLGQRELLLAVDVERQHRVGAGVAQHGREVVGVEFEVLRVAAVAVEDRGHLAVAPGATRRTLARLGAYRSGQLVRGGCLSHVVLLLCRSFVRARPGSQTIRCGFPSITVAGTTLAVTPGAARRRHRAQPGYPMNSSEREFGVRELLG